MSNNRDFREDRKRKTKIFFTWASIGAIILIILLFIWLTIADLLGDTDVAAFVTPGLYI